MLHNLRTAEVLPHITTAVKQAKYRAIKHFSHQMYAELLSHHNDRCIFKFDKLLQLSDALTKSGKNSRVPILMFQL